MTYLLFFVLVGFIFSLVAVASNPAPYFAALGLVVAAGLGCVVLIFGGGSFLSLVLFLIYLGGMLVVFAYSVALAAEPYPDSWMDWSVLLYVGVLFFGVVMFGHFVVVEFDSALNLAELGGVSILLWDSAGVSNMYSSGGIMLFLTGWVLLLTLFVVLELTRGLGRGSLRSI
uniref:NADH-ubiquinone oxidoreductase chain 6 n=1 Tax=Neoceratodus forsteri TaxID=7892 RepID=Q94XI6_NEOFS|nr:NADH dehydrogenase subunit 6 [Neoceratodus forsteri]AAL08600.1 NADH dehydrogenase subunit 6 [Neoceratodus forsteri]ATL15961.1 NADH dehydrogenase subunit 6 [Neoceratodus forsteri]ATL15974.1 NADH dehydrogenase subunit 6 [Neoceratodus forsteri]ATL15987.1 NADH dehydrogenase subunit 6 [Neoceratodus forsteri]ATL16000.1 NADH dehydrogenase subunit 6 [Neoceratodus forsteri]